MTDASWVTNLWPYSLQVGLLVIAMAAVLALLRVPSPRLRLVAWRVVLAVALLLPLQPWRVVRVVEVGPNATASARATTSAGAEADAATRGTTTDDAATQAVSRVRRWADAIGATGALRMVRGVLAADWTFAIAATLIAGAMGRLLWLAFGWHRLHRRLRQQMTPARFNRLESPLRPADELEKSAASDRAPGDSRTRAGALDAWQTELQQTMGTAARVEWIDDLSQPITFGVWPPVVLLPTRLASLPEEMQQAVVCHELLHVQRRDWLWVLGEESVRAVFWFHPAVWWLLDQLQAAREELVDRLTLRATGRRRAYLEALLAFAAEPEEPITGAAAAFFRSRQLGRRIASLMREGTMTRRQRIATVMGLGLTLAAALTTAMITFPLQATAAQREITVAESPARAAAAVRPGASARASGAGATAPVEQVVKDDQAEKRVMIRMLGAGGPIEQKARTLTKNGVAPRKINDVPFQFPPDLTQYATSAILALRIVLDDSGAVVESRVLSIAFTPVTPSLPMEVLDEQMKSLGEYTRNIVDQWRYEPIENAPLALTVTVNYDARSRRSNASDDARKPVVVKKEGERFIVHKLVDEKTKKTVPDDDAMAGGPGSGVSGGVSGGVPGGVAGGVPGGVAGGVPGQDRVLRLAPGDTASPKPGEGAEARPGLVRLAREAVASQPPNEEARQYPGHLRVSGSASPRVIEETRPAYPAGALKDKVQGQVVLDLEVDTDGRVTDAHVIDSVPALDDAAVDAVKQWRFAPTLVEGKAVPVVLTVVTTFTMR